MTATRCQARRHASAGMLTVAPIAWVYSTSVQHGHPDVVTLYRQRGVFGTPEPVLTYEVWPDGRVCLDPEAYGEDDHPDAQALWPAERAEAWLAEALARVGS